MIEKPYPSLEGMLRMIGDAGKRMSEIDAVGQSCCGNIAITPSRLKTRKQNRNVYVIEREELPF